MSGTFSGVRAIQFSGGRLTELLGFFSLDNRKIVLPMFETKMSGIINIVR